MLSLFLRVPYHYFLLNIPVSRLPFPLYPSYPFMIMSPVCHLKAWITLTAYKIMFILLTMSLSGPKPLFWSKFLPLPLQTQLAISKYLDMLCMFMPLLMSSPLPGRHHSFPPTCFPHKFLPIHSSDFSSCVT